MCPMHTSSFLGFLCRCIVRDMFLWTLHTRRVITNFRISDKILNNTYDSNLIYLLLEYIYTSDQNKTGVRQKQVCRIYISNGHTLSIDDAFSVKEFKGPKPPPFLLQHCAATSSTVV